jgi:hypothetical protein
LCDVSENRIYNIEYNTSISIFSFFPTTKHLTLLLLLLDSITSKCARFCPSADIHSNVRASLSIRRRHQFNKSRHRQFNKNYLQSSALIVSCIFYMLGIIKKRSKTNRRKKLKYDHGSHEILVYHPGLIQTKFRNKFTRH